MNRARVTIDKRTSRVQRWTGCAAVYDLDDGTRHVDIHELAVNGHEATTLPQQLREQIEALFSEQADREAEGRSGDLKRARVAK